MSDPRSPFEAKNTPSDVAGQMAGEYRLRRKLGEGGYGAVYEAEHPVLKRRAAVKVLHRSERMDSAGAMRFISEAQAANQIRSRYIVDIFSFGKLDDGRHFYVMDFLDGEPLDGYISKAAPVAVPDALQLLSLIAEALDAAHAAGIVHRDLKPQNIFLVWESSGETIPKLLDFGMAKLLDQTTGVKTASGAVIGTPLYMAPEQALGKKVDGRADVYALGILTHELLTAKRPITGENAMSVLAAHLTVQPPRASEVHSVLDARLDAPILRMLEKNPADRPATAGAAIAALKRAAEQAGFVVPAEPPRLPRPARASRLDDAVGLHSTGRSEPFTGADQLGSERGLEREVGLRTGDTQAARRSAVLPVLALLVVLGAGAAYVVTRANRDKEGQVGAVPSADAPAAPISAASVEEAPIAPVSPQPKPFVDVVVQGAPRGARVLFDGKPIGDAPGPVQLPTGDATVQLTVTAPGYETGRVAVIPNQSTSATVMMKKRASSPASSREGIPSDLENPF